ncbi:MAG TPA: AAA family ATPase [Firmicutes bacterium]|nr:AAA family ATPase [Bacillota bacterium]
MLVRVVEPKAAEGALGRWQIVKIKHLSISNLLSFRDETDIEFDQQFNILVGPNGGGKSNLLDIIMILMRHYFLPGVHTYEGREDGRTYVDLNSDRTFPHLPSVLDTFGGNEMPWTVKWEIVVTEDDLEFVRETRRNKHLLARALSRYRNKPFQDLNIVDDWLELLNFKPGAVLPYEITATDCKPLDEDARRFLGYLSHREIIYRLAEDIPDLTLPASYIYSSPYRGSTEESIRANLSGQRSDDLLRAYRSVTSRTTTSLLLLGTMYFAKKRRRYESLAGHSGYDQAWREDREVSLVSKYIGRLGYTWDLELIDASKNIYEILLRKGNHSFRIERASSGEREILSFLLGIFAFNMHGGIVVVDEPELHLHPKWQAVLRDLLSELAEETNNQIIVATHSPSFITRENIQKVIRVFRESDGASRIVDNSGKNLPSISGTLPDKKALTHMIMSHNNEKMFFADKVVLVEGITDRLLFNGLIQLCSEYLHRTDVTETLEVHGKHNFVNYQVFLRSIGQKVWIIADLDYITGLDNIPEIDRGRVRTLFCTDHKKIVKAVVDDKKSTDRVALMKVIEEAVEAQDLSRIDLQQLSDLYRHMASRYMRLRSDLADEEKTLLAGWIEAARKNGIFLLSRGEIDDYLPDDSKNLDGLLRLIMTEELKAWLSTASSDAALGELIEIVLSILEASEPERYSVMKWLEGGCKNPEPSSVVSVSQST